MANSKQQNGPSGATQNSAKPEAENSRPNDRPTLGNAADPTGQKANEAEAATIPDPTSELHTVGIVEEPRGALGKTDVNLGQDTPVGGGEASGRNINEDEAA